MTYNESSVLERRVEDLEEQVAYWKSEAGVVSDARWAARVREHYRVRPAHAQVLIDFATARDHFLPSDHLARGYADPLEDPQNQLKVYICQIRRITGRNRIETLWGAGFRISSDFATEIKAFRD